MTQQQGEKHTPGPWITYREDAAYPGIEADGVSIVVFGENEAWEEQCGVQGMTHEEAVANARLIARAPDMAAEIERLRTEMQRIKAHAESMGEKTPAQRCARIVEICRTALGMVEG